MWPAERRTATYDGVTYAPGRVFEVAREGARLTGWVPEADGGLGLWSKEMHPGDLLTCTGDGPGAGSDPGFAVEFTSQASEEARASHCTVSPDTGMPFTGRPAPGVLKPAGDNPAPDTGNPAPVPSPGPRPRAKRQPGQRASGRAPRK